VVIARYLLTRMGIDPAAGRVIADRRPARVPVLGGVLHLLVDGVRTDVLVIETGLLLVPSLPRFRGVDGRRRLVELAAGGVRADGSSAVAEPGADGAVVGGRFVPYADVATASVAAARRRRCTLTLVDGTVLTIRAGIDADELPGGWAAFDEAVGFLARTRRPVDQPGPDRAPAAMPFPPPDAASAAAGPAAGDADPAGRGGPAGRTAVAAAAGPAAGDAAPAARAADLADPMAAFSTSTGASIPVSGATAGTG
jgi:hypothetical protein